MYTLPLTINVSEQDYLVIVNYSVSDFSSNPKLSFFVDTNLDVLDGTKIGEIDVSSGLGSFNWDSYGFTPGYYYIYGTLDDGQNPPFSYTSSFPINVGDEHHGTSYNDLLYGNYLESRLFGYAGNDSLNGGAGNDYMEGGAGNDTYYVDADGDMVIEKADEGIDSVFSTISLVLYPNVENLTLVIGAGNISGAGNALDNTLTGNPDINTLTGGRGNDTYVIGAGDSVIEMADEGNDTVQSSVNYILGANLENLFITGGAFQGNGNELDNILIANTNVHNLLFGGAGDDYLDGGPERMYSIHYLYGETGNDTYIVNHVIDEVGEQADEGTDTVLSSINYTLGENVENLALTGNDAINGTGNGLNNVLIGNNNNNILIGDTGTDMSTDTLNGGLGADTLYGGAGSRDFFVFDTVLGSGNIDRLADFNKDIIALDIDVFTSLDLGNLPRDQFVTVKKGPVAALDANDYILYSKSSGTLYYDADGSGTGEAIPFATLSGKLKAGSITAVDWEYTNTPV